MTPAEICNQPLATQWEEIPLLALRLLPSPLVGAPPTAHPQTKIRGPRVLLMLPMEYRIPGHCVKWRRWGLGCSAKAQHSALPDRRAQCQFHSDAYRMPLFSLSAGRIARKDTGCSTRLPIWRLVAASYLGTSNKTLDPSVLWLSYLCNRNDNIQPQDS